jgi:hypothetical protein
MFILCFHNCYVLEFVEFYVPNWQANIYLLLNQGLKMFWSAHMVFGQIAKC